MVRLVFYSAACLLLVTLTARSFFGNDVLSVARMSGTSNVMVGQRGWGVMAQLVRGGAFVEWRRAEQSALSSMWVLPPPTGFNTGYPDGRYFMPDQRTWTFAGVEVAHSSFGSRGLYAVDRWSLRVPFSLYVLTAIFAALAVRRFIVIRRPAAPHLCRKCGYDLRGGHERCPECGLDVEAFTPPASSIAAGRGSTGR